MRRLVDGESSNFLRCTGIRRKHGVEKISKSKSITLDLGVPPRILDPADHLCARRRSSVIIGRRGGAS